GLYFSLSRLAQMIGPALAGAAVSGVGSPASFAIDAATFAVSTVCLFLIRSRATGHATAVSVASKVARLTEVPEVTEGFEAPGDAPSAPAKHDSLWRFALSTPYFLILLFVMIISNLINGVAEIALPALANGPLHGTAQGYGLMLAAAGGGGLAGGLLASVFGQHVKRGVTA